MNKKRIFTYIIIAVVFILMVIVKQNIIRNNRDKLIISMYSQWRQDGKPVLMEKIYKRDVSVFTKLTLRPMRGNTFQGYVPKSIQEKLSERQDIYRLPEDNKPIGYISYISDDITLDTGMFCVNAILESQNIDEDRQVVYVNTDLLKEVICVSDDVIDRENGDTYIWKIENGRAHKQRVEIGEHNGYGMVIKSGLSEGDLIVSEGFTQIEEDSIVDAVKNIDDPGVRQ